MTVLLIIFSIRDQNNLLLFPIINAILRHFFMAQHKHFPFFSYIQKRRSGGSIRSFILTNRFRGTESLTFDWQPKSRGSQRFPLVFDHQIRVGIFFFFFFSHPPFLSNAVLLLTGRGAGQSATRDAVKPWTSLSSSESTAGKQLENHIHEKFRSIYCVVADDNNMRM